MAAPSSTEAVALGQSRDLPDAIRGFKSILTKAERDELEKMRLVPDADAILVFTAELDACNRNRRGSSYASRLHTILSSVGSYCGIVNTFVSSNPEIAALVWGTMRLTMLVLTNFTSFYAATSDLFVKLGRLCTPFADYQALYPDSSPLQKALGEFHASIIRCCTHLVQTIRRTATEGLVKAFLKSFDKEFKPDLEDVESRAIDVKHKIHLAQAQAVRQDQQLQEIERQEAKESRLNFHRLISRVDERTVKTRDMQIQRDERHARERRQQLVDSLSNRSFLKLFKQNCQRRHCATTDWIFQTSEFKQWFHEDQTVLCLSGKIGSGKTVATSSVIQYLQRHKASSASQVSFFFVQAGEPDSLSATTILKSILQQMVEPSQMPAEIENALQSLNSSSDTEDILDVLRRFAPTTKFYIAMDGIDECERIHAVKLLKALAALVSCRGSLRLFLSSRPSHLPDISRHFKEPLHISLECQYVDADIATYINDAIDMKIDEDDLRVGDASLVGEIKSALTQGAQGMFLWAFFQIEEICSQHCDADIRAALVNLPKDLAQIFRRAFQRIAAGSHSNTAQSVFPWIACSKRPLTLAELREAITIEIGQKNIEQTRLANDMDKIATWCQNLVYVDEENLVVQFIHTSVRTFLGEKPTETPLSIFHLDLDQTNYKLGELCLTYLEFDDFKRNVATRPYTPPAPKLLHVTNPIGIVNSIPKPMSKRARLLSKFPIGSSESTFDLRPLVGPERGRPARPKVDKELYFFLAYASRHWISHTTRHRERNSKTWKILRQIIVHGHNVAKIPWYDGFQLPNSAVTSLEGVPFWDRESALAWAWQNGHFAAIRILATPDHDLLRMAALGRNYDLFDDIWDDPDLISEGRTLVYGAMVGHLAAVDAVISRGYDVTTPAILATTITKTHVSVPVSTEELIHIATKRLPRDAEQFLRSATGVGILVNLKKAFETAPKVQFDIVAIPLRAGAGSKAPTKTLAFMRFTKEGNLLGMELLQDGISDGVFESTTALKEASRHGHQKIVDMLLAAGANGKSKTSMLGLAVWDGGTAVEGKLGVAGASTESL